MECLKERNVALEETRRKMHNRNEWRDFVEDYK